jgi:hypothetical protein
MNIIELFLFVVIFFRSFLMTISSIRYIMKYEKK